MCRVEERRELMKRRNKFLPFDQWSSELFSVVFTCGKLKRLTLEWYEFKQKVLFSKSGRSEKYSSFPSTFASDHTFMFPKFLLHLKIFSSGRRLQPSKSLQSSGRREWVLCCVKVIVLNKLGIFIQSQHLITALKTSSSSSSSYSPAYLLNSEYKQQSARMTMPLGKIPRDWVLKPFTFLFRFHTGYSTAEKPQNVGSSSGWKFQVFVFVFSMNNLQVIIIIIKSENHEC